MSDPEPICPQCGAPRNANDPACPSCATAVVGTPVTRPRADTTSPDSIGPASGRALHAAGIPAGTVIDEKYEVVEKLGSGGFGDVYRVRHRILDRDLALKTLHPSLVIQQVSRERFFREARVLMDLSHPHIVTMRDVGEWQGYLYLVMDYCPGRTLAALLQQCGRVPPREACRLLLPALAGLQFAHERGIVHRDLKPANLILVPGESRDGRGGADPSVKILDFGIAKVIHEKPGGGESSLTGTGVAIGTIYYMSPEQAGGAKVDARSDLYAIGVILYELVTGRKPFDGEHMTHLYKQVLLDRPRPLKDQGVALTMPGLEDFLQSALEKDPEKRPPSAREMARRIEALCAAPPAPDRRPVPRAALLAVGLLAGIALAGAAWTILPRPRGPGPVAAANDPPANTTDPGKGTLPVNGPIDPPRNDPQPVPVETRPDLLVHPDRVNQVAFHPDGRWLATACADRRVRLWDLATGTEIARIEGHRAEVVRVAFHPDGTWLASTGEDSQVRVWSVPAGEPVFVFEDMKTPGEGLAFSPDRRLLAATARDGLVFVWDLDTRALLHTCPGHRRAAGALEFSANSEWLASGGVENSLRVWDPRAGKTLVLLLAHQRPVTGLGFLPDNRLVSAGLDGFVRIWPVPDKSPERSWLACAGGVSAMAVNPEGTRIATAGRDDTLRIWDAATGRELWAMAGLDVGTRALTWSPDGRMLATGSLSGKVRLLRPDPR